MASFSSHVLYHFFGPFLKFSPLRFSSLCVYSYVMKLLLVCASYKGERSDAYAGGVRVCVCVHVCVFCLY